MMQVGYEVKGSTIHIETLLCVNITLNPTIYTDDIIIHSEHLYNVYQNVLAVAKYIYI